MSRTMTRKSRSKTAAVEPLTDEKNLSPKRPPLNAAQQRLAAKYLPLARALAKPLKQAWPQERHEFESAACAALVEAAQAFDPERNVKFTTYARYRIAGALRDVQRGLVLAGWRCDMEHAPGVIPLCKETEELGKIIGFDSIRPVGEELEAVDSLENWFRKLPPKHAEVCRQLYIGSKNQYEVAEMIGCSRSRLSYLHKQALRMLNDIVSWENRDTDTLVN